MFVLNTGVTAVSPKLLSSGRFISRNIISQRSVNFAAVAFTPSNRGFSSQYNKPSTFPAKMMCRSVNLHGIGFREYVTKKTEDIESTPPPSPPNLPQREQIERACFRVIAFLWDCGYFIIAWLRKIVRTFIIEDPTVQLYWKRFHEKMAESKKSEK